MNKKQTELVQKAANLLACEEATHPAFMFEVVWGLSRRGYILRFFKQDNEIHARITKWEGNSGQK